MLSLVNSINQGRHIERKRNIPPNYRPARCHCEARSAAAIPLKKCAAYIPYFIPRDRHADARDDKKNASSFGVDSPAETGEMSR